MPAYVGDPGKPVLPFSGASLSTREPRHPAASGGLPFRPVNSSAEPGRGGAPAAPPDRGAAPLDATANQRDPAASPGAATGHFIHYDGRTGQALPFPVWVDATASSPEKQR